MTSLPGAGGGHTNTGWVCDKCGQALAGALDECNSGIHVGPDGKNKGHAVRAGGGHTADSDALIVKKITLGTRRQYAEQSKTWKHGERSEDQLLQRIWNLADDSFALIDFITELVARLEAAANRTAEETREKWAWNQKAGEMADQRNAAEAERDAALNALEWKNVDQMRELATVMAERDAAHAALREIGNELADYGNGRGTFTDLLAAISAQVARAVLGGPE